MVDRDTSARLMARALELAERGWGRVQPNPMVGAVLAQEGEVVGEGWHAEFGGPHAEIAALEAAGERARGATMYVSLEPCAHDGKTPPCTRAILSAGVSALVYGANDPHPRAAGGAALLRAAGLVVQGPVAAPEVRAQNAAFFHAFGSDRPFVALKLAVSLDGRLGRPGEETPVTGAEARAAVHTLRAGYGAIVVGSGTALADDPELTARGDVVPAAPPVRAVLASRCALDPSAKLFASGAPGSAWVFCAPDADPTLRRGLEERGARVVPVAAGDDGLNLRAVLTALGEHPVQSVLFEGGGRVAGSLLAADLVDRLHLFVAPRIFGPDGVPAVAGPGLPLTDPGGTGRGWRVTGLRPRGSDVEIVWDRVRGEG